MIRKVKFFYFPALSSVVVLVIAAFIVLFSIFSNEKNLFSLFHNQRKTPKPLIFFQPIQALHQDQHLSRGLTQMLLSYFQLLPKINVLDFRELEQLKIEFFTHLDEVSFANYHEFSKSLKADFFVYGSYQINEQKITIDLNLHDIKKNTRHPIRQVQGTSTNLDTLLKVCFFNLIQKLNEVYGSEQELFGDTEKQLIGNLPLFKNQALLNYFEGLYLEDLAWKNARLEYQKAVQLDKQLHFAADRLLFLNYFKDKNLKRHYAYFQKLMKTRVTNKYYALNFIDVLQELGRMMFRQNNYTDAAFLFELANEMFIAIDKNQSIQYAYLLIQLAETYLHLDLSHQALGLLKNAHEIYVNHNLTQSFILVKNFIQSGNTFSRLKQFQIAIDYYLNAEKILTNLNIKNRPLNALLANNTGVALLEIHDNDSAEKFFTHSLDVLMQNNFQRSLQFYDSQFNLSVIWYKNKKYHQSISLFESIKKGLNSIGFKNSLLYAHSEFNIAKSFQAMNKANLAKDFFHNAALLYKSHSEDFQSKIYSRHEQDLKINSYFSAFQIVYKTSLGLTNNEAERVKSYCGAYNFSVHAPAIGSRTYPGRLDDTNEMLKSLFNFNLQNQQIVKLRDLLQIEKSKPFSEYAFIDIGPAVANLENPAITSQSIAKDFPQLPVIAFDLPNEVERFETKVYLNSKRRLLGHKNIFIVSGNGVESLKTQLNEPERWKLKDRSIFKVEEKSTLILRAANSIDIYITWDVVLQALLTLADDFFDRPILYFFNKSILLKPANSHQFQVIGYVSIRGFHHNDISFSRQGEAPFTLVSEI